MSQPFLYIMFCTGRFFIYYQLLFMFLNMFAKHLDTGLCIVKTGAGNFICEVIWQTAVNPQHFISGILSRCVESARHESICRQSSLAEMPLSDPYSKNGVLNRPLLPDGIKILSYLTDKTAYTSLWISDFFFCQGFHTKL